MKNTIEVNGIKIYAFHGCLPEEEKIGGNYKVDISLQTNFTEASQTDELIKTVDYVDINKIVCEEMAIRSKLIEHVGQRIFTRIKKKENVLVQLGSVFPHTSDVYFHHWCVIFECDGLRFMLF